MDGSAWYLTGLTGGSGLAVYEIASRSIKRSDSRFGGSRLAVC